MAQVPSVLALSAMVMRAANGNALVEEGVQAAHARLEVGLLVVDGDDDVDDRVAGRVGHRDRARVARTGVVASGDGAWSQAEGSGAAEVDMPRGSASDLRRAWYPPVSWM